MWQILLPHKYTPYIYVVIIMYICSMNKGDIKIEQQSLSLGGCDNRTNYIIIIETLNDAPQNTYIVNLHDFLFYHEKMPFYVINQN